MPANPNFDSVLATTLDNHRETLTDNLSKNVAVWHFLEKHGSVKTKGGNKVVEPIISAANGNVKSYSGYETLTRNATDELTAAEYPWRQVAGTVYISGIEEAKNSGPEAVIDLVEAKMDALEISLIDAFETQLVGNGTGTSGKDFMGIDGLIDDENATGGNPVEVGGIDCTDSGSEFWQSYVDRTAGPLTIQDMTHAFHKASRGPIAPNWGLTTLELFESYNNLLQPMQRFTDPKTAEAGFRNLTFQGQPIVWSDYANSGTVIFVNSKFVKLYKLGDNWLKHTPWASLPNEDARSTNVLSYGNMGITNRQLGGSKLTNRTAV